jgi:hypothetical protein
VSRWHTERVGRVVATVGAVLLVVLVAVGLLTWVADDHLPAGHGADPQGQVGVAWQDGLLSPDGSRLAVRFTGVADGGDRPCGAWYIGLSGALMQGQRVTVITMPGSALASGSSCPPPGTPRCTEVRLPYPPAGDPVFDGISGSARPVRTAPHGGDLCGQLLA